MIASTVLRVIFILMLSCIIGFEPGFTGFRGFFSVWHWLSWCAQQPVVWIRIFRINHNVVGLGRKVIITCYFHCQDFRRCVTHRRKEGCKRNQFTNNPKFQSVDIRNNPWNLENPLNPWFKTQLQAPQTSNAPPPTAVKSHNPWFRHFIYRKYLMEPVGEKMMRASSLRGG